MEDSPGTESVERGLLRRGSAVLLATVLTAVLWPWVRSALFPGALVRLGAAIEEARFSGCRVEVAPEDAEFLRLRISVEGGLRLTTELFEPAIRTLDDGRERLLVDSIGENEDESYYATRTVVEQDAAGARILSLEGFRCPLLTEYSSEFLNHPDRTPPCAVELLTFACDAEGE